MAEMVNLCSLKIEHQLVVYTCIEKSGLTLMDNIIQYTISQIGLALHYSCVTRNGARTTTHNKCLVVSLSGMAGNC